MSRILRLREVEALTGMSKTSIWRLERKGQFPVRRSLGVRCVGWREEEIQEWLRKLSAPVTSAAAALGQPNDRAEQI